MRKLYLLTTLFLGLVLQSKSQDLVNFNYHIGINNNVEFMNLSQVLNDGPRKAFWYFGDGTSQVTAPLANAFHHYNTAGTYTACLKIYKYSSNTDSVLTGQKCKTFTIGSATTPDSCKANFSNNATSINGLSQTFAALPWHNNNKKPERICWTFGDGSDTCINYNPALSNNYAVHHTYSQPGQYNVCVKIKYQGGCEAHYCRMITTGGEICRSDFTTDSVSSSTLTKHFSAQPWHVQNKKPVKICWTFGDGTSECKQYAVTHTGPYSISHTYAQPGQYNVCVKIFYDGGCESQKCKPVSVLNPAPVDSCRVSVFEYPTNSNALARKFYASLMPNRVAERICWYFGDGTDTCYNLSNPVSPQSLMVEHRYPAPGVYRVCVKVKYAGGCEAIKCREVVIRPNSTVCGGYMTDSLVGPRTYKFKGFSIMNPNDHVISWRWTFGDGTSATGQEVSHTYINAGSYEVCLYIKTDKGCETRICKRVTTIGGNNHAQLQLTPNPVVTVLHAMFLSTRQEQVTIKIYNSNGVVVRSYTRNAIPGANNWSFPDVATLPAGAYSMIVMSPHQLANAVFFKL